MQQNHEEISAIEKLSKSICVFYDKLGISILQSENNKNYLKWVFEWQLATQAPALNNTSKTIIQIIYRILA